MTNTSKTSAPSSDRVRAVLDAVHLQPFLSTIPRDLQPGVNVGRDAGFIRYREVGNVATGLRTRTELTLSGYAMRSFLRGEPVGSWAVLNG
jgi:hypothetical protein